MIKIEKGDEPESLQNNKIAWLKELMDLIDAGQKVPDHVYSRYNRDDVKEALRTECRSKCMYCESNVEHISHLHIEHIKPKARLKYPELTYQFENLGLACPVCNENKSDTYEEERPFINPYEDDPTAHFRAFGAFVMAKPGNRRARFTEIEIELNRAGLLEKRGDRIKMLRGLLEEHANEANEAAKAALRREILLEVDSSKEYSFCGKAIVDALL